MAWLTAKAAFAAAVFASVWPMTVGSGVRKAISLLPELRRLRHPGGAGAVAIAGLVVAGVAERRCTTTTTTATIASAAELAGGLGSSLRVRFLPRLLDRRRVQRSVLGVEPHHALEQVRHR